MRAATSSSWCAHGASWRSSRPTACSAGAAEHGRHLRARLDELAAEFPGLVLDVRGRGPMCAFSLPTTTDRDKLIRGLWQRGVIVLPSGYESVRFRPALTVSGDEIDQAVAAVRQVLEHLT